MELEINQNNNKPKCNVSCIFFYFLKFTIKHIIELSWILYHSSFLFFDKLKL